MRTGKRGVNVKKRRLVATCAMIGLAALSCAPCQLISGIQDLSASLRDGEPSPAAATLDDAVALRGTPSPAGVSISLENATDIRLVRILEHQHWRHDPQGAWSSDKVSDVSFSPDGTIIASSWGSMVHLWNAADGMPLRSLQGHTAWVNGLAFSPDGEILASGSDDWSVRLWRVADGKPVRDMRRHTYCVHDVDFSADGRTVASVSGPFDGTARIWRASDGDMLHTLEHRQAMPDPWGELRMETVWSAAFSPDGEIVATGSWDSQGNVRMWRLSDGSLIRTLKHSDWVYEVAFSPDGQLLASATGKHAQEVRLWYVENGAPYLSLGGNLGEFISSVAFSPDGQLLASGSGARGRGTVRVWSVGDGALLHTLPAHSDWVWSVAFSPDGKLLASGSRDGTVRLWGIPISSQDE